MSKDDLSAIFDRISNHQATDADLSLLRKVLGAVDNRQLALQLGKFNVNIGEGKEIHIGDRIYNEWNEEAVT